MRRTAGIPIGILVLLAIPFAVPKPTEPQPREGALTVPLAGDEGASAKQPAYVPVRAEGAAPARTQRTQPTGRHSAYVASSVGKCTGEPRSIGVPPERGTIWCLRFTSVDLGVTLTGEVSASNPAPGSEFTKLALTVTRRDAFVPLPLLTIFAGLLVGGLAIIVPAWLFGLVKRVGLSELLERNKDAKPAANRITDLHDWVQDRLRDGKTVDELLDPVGRIVRYGPARAQLARATLKEALDEAAFSDDMAFTANAREEQDRTDNRVSDFLNADLTGLTKHPVAAWTGAVSTLVEHVRTVERQQWEFDHRIADGCPARESAQSALADAKARVETAEDPDDVAELAGPMRDLAATIRSVRAQPGCPKEPEPGVKPLAAPAPGTPVQAPVLDLSGNWRARSGLAIVIGVCAGLAIVAYAGVSLYFNAYDPKPTFHAFGADYLALFVAALGSGAVGAVLELLGYWKPGLVGSEA